MADNYLRLGDTISSKEGTAYITIDGVNRELFEISSIEAKLELTVQSKTLLGHRMEQHKVTGAKGTGTMGYYFMTSEMLELANKYLKTGSYGGIKIQVRNYDSQSTVGTQDVVLTNVILNTIPVFKLDDSSDDPLTQETDFTFDDIIILDKFVKPENYR